MVRSWPINDIAVTSCVRIRAAKRTPERIWRAVSQLHILVEHLHCHLSVQFAFDFYTDAMSSQCGDREVFPTAPRACAKCGVCGGKNREVPAALATLQKVKQFRFGRADDLGK